MIPTALITGFLGSGKTTFLQQVIAHFRGRKLIYLVNEFSPADVDGQMLSTQQDGVLALPGGSIFCTCLVSEFVQAMTSIPARFHSDGAPIDGVVIEASGVANPGVIEKLLRETHLDELYRLSCIVSITDPGTFPVLVQTLPNIIAQVKASDAVVLNKSDLFDEEILARAEAEITRIRPGMRIFRTRFCEAPLGAGEGSIDLFGERAIRGLDGEYAKCADPHYARASLRFPSDTDIEALRKEFSALREALYRVKGFIRSEGAWRYVDWSPAAFTVRPDEGPHDEAMLVAIGRGDAYPQLQALAAQARRGEFGLTVS